jgi:hypothetical protein
MVGVHRIILKLIIHREIFFLLVGVNPQELELLKSVDIVCIYYILRSKERTNVFFKSLLVHQIKQSQQLQLNRMEISDNSNRKVKKQQLHHHPMIRLIHHQQWMRKITIWYQIKYHQLKKNEKILMIFTQIILKKNILLVRIAPLIRDSV